MTNRLASAFKQALFPCRCLVCRKLFHPADPAAAANRLGQLTNSLICQQCTQQFVPIESPICTCCGIPFSSRQGVDHRCGGCLKRKPPYATARAAGVYEAVLKKAIHRFKFDARLQLGIPLGDLLRETLQRFWAEEDFDLILPVPLHPRRLRQRGFNQAYLLARRWQAKIAQHETLPSTISLERNLLVRTTYTRPQTGLDRKDRIQNLKGVFHVNNARKVSGKRILLVDDVHTTGATVNECAATLMRNGARRVDVLTLARAGKS